MTIEGTTAGSTATSSMQDRLSRCRDATLSGLLGAVPDRDPRRYLYGPLVDHLSRMGKGLRPALCLATCAAFGGAEERARPSALAIEMLHNAFLVHDDVEDGSELRRGRPTMHAEHGVPIAVNAGDMLTALAVGFMRENVPTLGAELTWQVLGEFEHLLQQSLEGQAMELGWIRDNRCDITEADYLQMVLKKTCWYSFIHPCRIGALIAAGDGIDLDRFNRFGFYLGAAFQIQDDLLNLTGDEKRYGKEIGGDIFEGKRTLMLVHLFQTLSTPEMARMQVFLGQARAQRSIGDVNWVLDLMRSRGSLRYSQSAARQLAGAALYEFASTFGDRAGHDEASFVRDLTYYMVERSS